MLDLSDDEIAALLAELDRIIDGDRFPLSPHIRILTGIRDKLQPPPARAVAEAEALLARCPCFHERLRKGAQTPARDEIHLAHYDWSMLGGN